jgi:hypothetical protein
MEIAGCSSEGYSVPDPHNHEQRPIVSGEPDPNAAHETSHLSLARDGESSKIQ